MLDGIAKDGLEDVYKGQAMGFAADNTARQVMRKRLREGAMDDKEIEIELAEATEKLAVLAAPFRSSRLSSCITGSLLAFTSIILIQRRSDEAWAWLNLYLKLILMDPSIRSTGV